MRELGIEDEYPYFESYWAEPDDRWPYLIEVENHPAGFALINRHSLSGRPVDFALAEFYIHPDHRGQGHGRVALGKILSLHPGRWELSILQGNEGAKRFWPAALHHAGIHTIESFAVSDATILRFAVLPA